MPTRIYQLNGSEIRQVRLTWRFGWRQITVWLDAQRLRMTISFLELREGIRVVLPDRSELTLRLSFPCRDRDLIVTYNGERLYGHDPALPAIQRQTDVVLFNSAGMLLVMGLIATLLPNTILEQVGVGLHSAISGAVLLALCAPVRSHSLFAMLVCTIVIMTHWLLALLLAGGASIAAASVLMLWHVTVGLLLLRGTFAIADWWRQFPPPPPREQSRIFWRNVAILCGVMFSPLVVLVVMLYWPF